MNAPARQSFPSVAQAERVLAQGSKSFAGAARLFPNDIRTSVTLLYAWCRDCDDLIDGQILGFANPDQGSEPPSVRLDRVREGTLRALAGNPEPGTSFEGLAYVVRRHGIPHRYPLDLVAGFAMDVEGRRYERFSDTLSYCYHVAGAVGVMMAIIMGVKDEPMLDRACDLGLALQLTNIARDVIDDAKAGRVYIPQTWLDAQRITTPLDAPQTDRRAVHHCATRLLDAAELYYDSAEVGLSALPFRCALAVELAARVYRAIGTQVRARGAAAWDQRIVVSAPQKAMLAPAALGAAALAQARNRNTPRPAGLWTRSALEM